MLFFRLAAQYLARSVTNSDFRSGMMENSRDQTSMGVGHLEPDTSSDDFAEDVRRKATGGVRRAETVPHSLADV